MLAPTTNMAVSRCWAIVFMLGRRRVTAGGRPASRREAGYRGCAARCFANSALNACSLSATYFR